VFLFVGPTSNCAHALALVDAFAGTYAGQNVSAVVGPTAGEVIASWCHGCCLLFPRPAEKVFRWRPFTFPYARKVIQSLFQHREMKNVSHMGQENFSGMGECKKNSVVCGKKARFSVLGVTISDGKHKQKRLFNRVDESIFSF
jgi:hypothetical protein